MLSIIEASGQSRGDFARRIGLDDSKLSKSLGGIRRFSSLDLARIAEECHVTVDWLVTGEEPPLAMAARTTTGEARTAVEAAKRYNTMRGDLASLGYPQPWRPVPVPDGGNYVEQGRRLATDALARVSEAGRAATEASLPLLAEDVFGADVAVIGLDEGFDGLSACSAEARLIVLATSTVPWRQRYTCAHELAHLLAVLCDFAAVDRLDLLRSVLDGRGRWTEAVAYEARKSARYLPALAMLASGSRESPPGRPCS